MAGLSMGWPARPPRSVQGGTVRCPCRPGQLGAFSGWRRGTRGSWNRGAQSSDQPLLQRQYELLDRTTAFELWLIHWPTDGGLVLHDHGGSSGAFHVVWVPSTKRAPLAAGRP
jgi:hypothetical protein